MLALEIFQTQLGIDLRGKLLEVDSYQISVKGWGLRGETPKTGGLA